MKVSVSPCWIAGFLAAGMVVATAAPLVPSSELPGRERDRFTESPVERFMRSGPYVSAPVIGPRQRDCGIPPKRHAKRRSARQKDC
jgi:hypothetical protein